jgi:uncharacterized membrane protein
MAVNVELLADIPLFALLDVFERKALASTLQEVELAAGDHVFREGDTGDSVYLVLKGRISIRTFDDEGNTIVIGEQTKGEAVGELSLLDGGPRTSDAVVLEDAELLIFHREDLVLLLTRFPQAALDLLAIMGKRLRATGAILRTRVVRNVNDEAEEKLTFGERVSDKVAEFGGSWRFIIAFSGMMFVWMTLNGLILGSHAYDPFPFILLNLVLSALAALQAPVIMMSQNRQAAKDRLRSDLDYEIDRKAELEVTHLHRKIDQLRTDLLLAIRPASESEPKGN